MIRHSGFESLKHFTHIEPYLPDISDIKTLNETKLETLVSYVIPYCETSPTQIDIWEFAPSHRCRFPDNFLLLWAPARCALVIWWFCWGKKPLDLEKLATHKEDIFLLVANFHWFIIGIGCWFHPQTLDYHVGRLPAVTSWSIISPATIDHRHIMIRHDTSTINPSYLPIIKHGTWTSPIYILFSQLQTSI